MSSIQKWETPTEMANMYICGWTSTHLYFLSGKNPVRSKSLPATLSIQQGTVEIQHQSRENVLNEQKYSRRHSRCMALCARYITSAKMAQSADRYAYKWKSKVVQFTTGHINVAAYKMGGAWCWWPLPKWNVHPETSVEQDDHSGLHKHSRVTQTDTNDSCHVHRCRWNSRITFTKGNWW